MERHQFNHSQNRFDHDRESDVTSSVLGTRLHRYSIYSSIVVIVVGCLVLVGWQFNIAWLKSLIPGGFATMKANTAIAFILSGLSLWLTLHSTRRTRRFRFIARFAAAAVLLIGLLTLCQYAFNWDLGIDQLLFRNDSSQAATPFPGRMGLNTAINFVFTGCALGLLQSRSRRADALGQFFALLVTTIAAQAFIGYAYGVRLFYQFNVFTTSMAFHTAITFLVLGLGILFIKPERALMQPITSFLSGGVVAQKILPFAILFPFVIGGLIIQGWRSGYYDPAFAMSLLVIMIIVASILFIWRTAALLNREDKQRRSAEQKLRDALDALRDREDRISRLVDANLIGILLGDVDGGIHEVNDELLRIVGYTREEFNAGQLNWVNITPPKYLPLDDERIAEAKRRGACTPYEKEYIRKDGSRVPVYIGYVLVGESRRNSIAFIIDQSERKQLEQNLRQQAEELERANRLKDEFLAVLSHELRTPLNPILGWTQLLKTRQLDPERTASALDTIERNAKLQITLIEDLLDISRILRGKLKLKAEPVDLSGVIRAAIETTHLAAQAKSIQVKFVGSTYAALVIGDRDRLQQVVWNLLSNAVKFTPEGGRVTVGLSAARSVAQIVVSDTGQGISRNFLPYVFDQFRQEEGGTTRQFGGLGLGLAIARHLVELHGGTIQVESLGVGQGATFTVKLPLVQDKRENRIEIRAAHRSAASPLPLLGMKLLVVDDEIDNLEFLVFLLETYGASAIGVETATQALECILQDPPQVLISDIGMPEMDGYALIKTLRSSEVGQTIPAIALTAFARETDQAQILATGFQHHVTKPIDPEKLVEILKRYKSEE